MSHSEALTIALHIEKKIKSDTLIDVTVLNTHLENEKEKIIQDEILKLPKDIKTRIENEFFGLGPIQTLMDDPNVTEIIINSPESIWYEINNLFIKLNDTFLTPITYQNFMDRLIRRMNGHLTLDKPFYCGQINNYRVHLAGTAVTEGSPLITIRKHSSRALTLQELETNKWASPDNIQKLKELLSLKRNLLIVGPTGSGKTTVLNSLLCELPPQTRAIILEDTNELKCPNDCSSKLLTREDAQGLLSKIELSDLLKQSLRMRPERIVVGEVRGPEAKDLLLALSTGHAGSMGTLHASSAEEALIRLEMLVQLGAPQWGLDAIRKLIYLSIQNIVVVGFDSENKRSLVGIYKISGIETFGITLDPI